MNQLTIQADHAHQHQHPLIQQNAIAVLVQEVIPIILRELVLLELVQGGIVTLQQHPAVCPMELLTDIILIVSNFECLQCFDTNIYSSKIAHINTYIIANL